jgi:hypothetical protein
MYMFEQWEVARAFLHEYGACEQGWHTGEWSVMRRVKLS